MSMKERREAAGMTQAELAAAVGLHPSAVCLYEAGKRTMKVSIAIRIARALNCTLDELMKD